MSVRVSNTDFTVDIDIVLTADSEISMIEGTASIKASADETVEIDLVYDGSSISKVGEDIIRISVTAGDDSAPVSIVLRLTTEKYSDESSKYAVLLEITESEETITGSASIYFPAKSTAKVSSKAKLYLDHGTKIINSYPKYLARAESLNNEMMEILSSGDFSTMPSSWVTYDSATGIYFLTEIYSSGGSYTSTTYSSPDAFRYAYAYTQNYGGFKKEGSPLAEREARRLAELILKDTPDGVENLYGTFYTYTYIEEYDV